MALTWAVPGLFLEEKEVRQSIVLVIPYLVL